VLGALLAHLPSALRLRAGVILAILLGGIATTVSGESAVSWSYLLLDTTLVAASSLISMRLSLKLGWTQDRLERFRVQRWQRKARAQQLS
jgi:hypothetical protein